jgi:alpha-mannosidase
MNISLKIFPLPMLKKDSIEMLRCLDLIITTDEIYQHQDACLKIISKYKEWEYSLGSLVKGENKREIFFPEVVNEEEISCILNYGDHKITSKLTMKPVKKWEIYLVLHSHTDLGFTAPISDVRQIHNDNTDLAVLYCRETEHWPEGSRFKWTCEISWQVQNYLRDRDKNSIDLLVEQLQKKNIEVGALYSGELTEILGHEQAVRSLYFAAKLRRDYYIDIDTAMLCDVPGCTKGFVQVMAKSGIKNFILADNNFIAPFLSRTDLPRPFYWSGDAGSKVLAWYTDHPFYAYIEGQNYGLSDSYTETRNKLPYKLMSLEENGYPFNEFQFQYAFDNFRIEFRPAAIVKEWNDKWEYPKLKLATAGEFLNKVREKHDAEIPIIKGDWTNWWDGIVTGFPYETAKSRYLHNKIPALEILSSVVSLNSSNSEYPLDIIENLYDNTLAFDEHSGSGMVWEAKSEEQQQKALLEGFGYIYNSLNETASLENIKTNELSALFKNNSDSEVIAVFNPLNFTASGLVITRYNNSTPVFLQDYTSNKSIPVRNRNGVIEFYAEDIPPLGIRAFKVVPGAYNRGISVNVTEEEESLSIENSTFNVKFRKSDGKVYSVYNKSIGQELIKNGCNIPLIYEPKPVYPILMGKYSPDVYNGVEYPGEIKQQSPESESRVVIEKDEIYGGVLKVIHSFKNEEWLIQKYFLSGDCLNIENTLNGMLINNIEFLKKYLTDKGILYFQFNLDITNSHIRYDAPCSMIEPVKDIFKGSCKDYSAIQNWLQFYNNDKSINFVSIDAPLIDIGGIAHMKYRENFPENPQDIFVRACSLNEFNLKNNSPFNNKPDLTYRFVLSASPPGDSAVLQAYKTGQSSCNELFSFIIPPYNKGILEAGDLNIFKILPECIQVMTIKKAESGEGFIIRIREPLGTKSNVELSFSGGKIAKVYKTMMSEEIIEEMVLSENKIKYEMTPYSIETFNIQLS